VTASIIPGNTYLETLERALDQSESLRDFQHQLAASFQVLNQLETTIPGFRAPV
jgi:hypothetical protein